MTVEIKEASACPVPGCREPVVNQQPTTTGSRKRLSCGKHWVGLTRMCRGKRRQSETKARIIQLTKEHLQAYLCPVCGAWHNGNAVSGDLNIYHQDARFLVAAMRLERGDAWMNALIARWDPEFGKYSRTGSLPG